MLTWANRVDVEIPKVKGSRFLGAGAPVGSEDEAVRFLRSVREVHKKASHVAFGWILPDGNARSADDGEVSGTAGPPILARLEGAELSGVALAVVRYYGGTNLGKGGLVRAYGATARAVVDAAETLSVEKRIRVKVEVAAAFGSGVLAVLSRAGFVVLDAQWGAAALFFFEGPEAAGEGARREALEAGRGTTTWTEVEA